MRTKRIISYILLIALCIVLVGCDSEPDDRLKMPSSSRAYKGANYQDVINELKDAGFTNIETEVLDDLITGWLTKDGEVEQVEVDGDTTFSTDTKKPHDVKIVVTYHTFPEESEEVHEEAKQTQQKEIDKETELKNPMLPSETVTEDSESTNDKASEMPKDSIFTVHYIDVGQADSALVICDGKAMLIDGGNVADSSLIYSYLKKLNIDHLDVIVCTHAHEDHVGGLAGALNYAKVDKIFAPVTSYDSKAFSNFVKYLDKQSKTITMPSPGDEFTLGSAKVKVLGPINPSEETNNTSIVLRIVYGNTSFLFTGDAERNEEQDILNAGFSLSSTVLKIGHHGSETSTTYPFLREIMPEYAIISTGMNNSYGHPSVATLSRLRDADVKVYRTDMQGDIICTSDGKDVSFVVKRNAEADTLSSVRKNDIQDGNNAVVPESTINPSKEAPTGIDYVLNTNTKKFHYPTCSSVNSMKEGNKKLYNGNREDIINQGYSPCGRCHP